MSGLEFFAEPTRAWFRSAFESATAVQVRGWERIAAGEHALLSAPTGSGKTLAAFLWCLDQLMQLPPQAPPGVRVVYVSPLKSLVYDIERNLRAPLIGITQAAHAQGMCAYLPRVALRTGDTPQQERRAQAKAPAEVLVTTPESLYLILGSQQRATLATVHTVIVDEIHALVATKRGAHLALSLERLASGAESDPQRVGLSATARPLPVVARYLGGDRPVAVVDAPQAPNLDLQITVPVEDMVRPAVPADPSSIDSVADRFSVARSPSGSLLGELPLREGSQPAAGLWPTVYPRLLALIKDHRTTLIFVNSRGLCERLCNRLNELAGDELVRAHHGSLAHEQRKAVEQALKLGHIRAIVATSSLELGIDMGTLDLVVMVESPGAVSRGLRFGGGSGRPRKTFVDRC